MSLAPGTRLGTYEVLGLIGARAWERFAARVTASLNRDVALKILWAEARTLVRQLRELIRLSSTHFIVN
jgi:hypothetical protein